jgi:hypothetical protein
MSGRRRQQFLNPTRASGLTQAHRPASATPTRRPVGATSNEEVPQPTTTASSLVRESFSRSKGRAPKSRSGHVSEPGRVTVMSERIGPVALRSVGIGPAPL